MFFLILYSFTFYIALVSSINANYIDIEQNDMTQNEVYQIVTNPADLYNLNFKQVIINDYSYDIEINKNVDKTLNELNDTTLNMMILGKSGVGKSVLINSLFDFDEAENGIGLPITKEIRSLHKKGFKYTLYDTPGLELDNDYQKHVSKSINDII